MKNISHLGHRGDEMETFTSRIARGNDNILQLLSLGIRLSSPPVGCLSAVVLLLPQWNRQNLRKKPPAKGGAFSYQLELSTEVSVRSMICVKLSNAEQNVVYAQSASGLSSYSHFTCLEELLFYGLASVYKFTLLLWYCKVSLQILAIFWWRVLANPWAFTRHTYVCNFFHVFSQKSAPHPPRVLDCKAVVHYSI